MKRADRLYIASVTVLAVGLAAAVLIYLGADDDSAGAMDPFTNSKMYARQLQLYGGKALIVFDDAMRWFDGLWHGRKLAFTVGWLSLLAAAGLFLAANRLDDD